MLFRSPGFRFGGLLFIAVVASVASTYLASVLPGPRFAVLWSWNLAALAATVGFVCGLVIWWIWQNNIVSPSLYVFTCFSCLVGLAQGSLVINVIGMKFVGSEDGPFYLSFIAGSALIFLASLWTRPYVPKGAAYTE